MAEYKIKDAKTADINEIFFDKNTNKMSYKNYLGIVTIIPDNVGVQSVVAGTNITVDNTNPANPIISASGGGGGGVHALLKPTTGQVMSGSLTGTSLNSIATTANRLTAQPFIPSKTFTTSNFYINVSTVGLGVNARILIYSDLNGIPTTKLYESANLDCSTTGQKTATTSFTFTAGTTYWLCTHCSGTANLTSFPPAAVITILISGTSNIASYIYNYTFGSAPTTLTGQGDSVTAIPAVFITAA